MRDKDHDDAAWDVEKPDMEDENRTKKLPEDRTVYGTTQSEQAVIERYTTPPTPDDLRDALDELCEAVGEFQDVSDAWAKSTAETYQMEYAQKAVNAARLAVEALFEKQQAEIGARGKLYGDMCGVLHDCCQKYRLGLGGENIAELVTEEVGRLRATMLTRDEALFLYGIPPHPGCTRAVGLKRDRILERFLGGVE